MQLENSMFSSMFSPPHRCLTPPSEGTPCDIDAICMLTPLKSTFNGLQLSMTIWGYLHSFSRCWLPTLRNPKRIRGYSRSRSSKVIDLGVSQKRICDFLLVINSNFGRISYGFRDIDAFIFKIACFPFAHLIV